MNKKNTIGLAVSIVLLGLAALFYQFFSPSDNRPGHNELGYYFDLNTRELFVRDGTLRPPIEAPSGPDQNGHPAGVRAYVYGQAEGAGQGHDVKIAFLEYEIPGGAVISDSNVIKWVSATSVPGTRLRQSCVQRCIDQGYTERVYPRSR